METFFPIINTQPTTLKKKCQINQYISIEKQKIQLLNDIFLMPQGDI